MNRVVERALFCVKCRDKKGGKQVFGKMSYLLSNLNVILCQKAALGTNKNVFFTKK
jgi:hypothetical protein